MKLRSMFEVISYDFDLTPFSDKNLNFDATSESTISKNYYSDSKINKVEKK